MGKPRNRRRRLIMIKIYEASNGLEAKLILDLLQQAQLSARIDGEYLQGGIGDIQASGLVRVMISESDFKQGKLLISQWENNEFAITEDENLENSNHYQEPEANSFASNVSTEKMLNYLVVGIVCLLIGVFSTAYYYRSPTFENGVDYDGDGIPDEWWVYKGNRISETRMDRNFDKNIDLYLFYDHKGNLESMVSDDNFDGEFETGSKIKHGNWVWTNTDTTGDGFKNYQVKFKHGIIDTISYYHPQTKNKVKTEKYVNLVLSYSEIDTNKDGMLDSRIEYDEYANPVKTILIQ